METGNREELLVLYQVTCADLIFFKSQQWLVVNYTTLAFAALVGISQIFKHDSVGWYLAAFALATFVFAKIMLRELNGSIDERRARLDACRPHLGKSFNEVWAAGRDGASSSRRGRNDSSTRANILFYDALHWALDAAFAITVGLLVASAWPQ